MMKVELLESMGGDQSISNSARVSFSKWKESFDETDEKLISYLAKHKHLTPFRHNCLQVRCKAPIFLARQLMKHQAGLTWNEESRRYIEKETDYLVPDEWRKRPEGGIKQGSGGDAVKWIDEEIGLTPQELYQEVISTCESTYRYFLEVGIAPEMARMVLPQSLLVEWIWTGNLLAFSHVYNLRIKENSQREAQVFAQLLGEAVKPVFPVGWRALTED